MNYELTAGFSPSLAGCPSAGRNAFGRRQTDVYFCRRVVSKVDCMHKLVLAGMVLMVLMVSPARRRIWLNTLLPPLTLFATA